MEFYIDKYWEIRQALYDYYNLRKNITECKFYIWHFLSYIDYKLLFIKDKEIREQKEKELVYKIYKSWQDADDHLYDIEWIDDLYEVFKEILIL